ncbi:MAG: polysaccharide deacetylase family protein [Clostridia bacterium]|nr:polysaccharide deacetylase family protein [Clostridia bacterium]
MKRIKRLISLMALVFIGAAMLSGVSAAEEKLSLKLSVKAESIELTWNGSKKESYTVYKKTGKGKFVKADRVTGKKYTDKDLESGETYTYYIKKSKKVRSEQKKTVYVAPPKMKKSSVGSKGVTLKWNESDGAEKYIIYRRAEGGKKKRLAVTDENSYKDLSVKKGVIYTYTVKSVRGEAVSASSSAVRTGRLTAPELISLSKSADGLRLKWGRTENAEKYAVYRKKGEKGKWKKIASVNGKTFSYEDKNVEDRVKYSYYVRAQADESRSIYEKKSISQLCLKAPDGFTLKVSGKKISLDWKKTEGAESYQVYRQTGDGKWKKVKTVKADKYSEALKSTGNKVSYKVRAVTDKGKTAFTAVKSNRGVDPSKPMVALTYDDGPHPVNTHRILDALEKHGARATFFVVGSRVTDYKDCLERQAELGCEIANHSFSHTTLSVSKDKTVREEIEKTDALIEKYSGQKPVLCRAPGGSVGKAAKLTDRPFIHWSVDTLDWQSRSCSKVVSHIRKNVRDGSIILMHDLYGSTAEASEIIIPWLISEGYQLVTVSEMLEARSGGADGGKIYYNGYA